MKNVFILINERDRLLFDKSIIKYF